MTEQTPEPDGPDDERIVYVVTAAGLEAMRQSALVVDSQRKARTADAAVPDDRPRPR